MKKISHIFISLTLLSILCFEAFAQDKKTANPTQNKKNNSSEVKKIEKILEEDSEVEEEIKPENDLSDVIPKLQKLSSSRIEKSSEFKKILDARYHNLLIDIKLKCINVLYDNLIHSSQELINLIKKDKEFKYNILNDLYKKVYNDIFSRLTDYVDFNIQYILPQVIHNTVNGHQGLLYGNILSLILAFNAYTSINSNNRLDKLFELLENKNYSYKKNLIKFISNIDEDYYNKFLKECLKIKNIIIDNYFDDVTGTATATSEN